MSSSSSSRFQHAFSLSFVCNSPPQSNYRYIAPEAPRKRPHDRIYSIDTRDHVRRRLNFDLILEQENVSEEKKIFNNNE